MSKSKNFLVIIPAVFFLILGIWLLFELYEYIGFSNEIALFLITTFTLCLFFKRSIYAKVLSLLTLVGVIFFTINEYNASYSLHSNDSFLVEWFLFSTAIIMAIVLIVGTRALPFIDIDED